MQEINFSDNDLKVMSEKFKMLSKHSRLKIIRALFGGEKSVTEIVNETGLMQANVSKQLKLLQNSGMVECRPEGLMRYYRIADPTIKNICAAICQSKEQ